MKLFEKYNKYEAEAKPTSTKLLFEGIDEESLKEDFAETMPTWLQSVLKNKYNSLKKKLLGSIGLALDKAKFLTGEIPQSAFDKRLKAPYINFMLLKNPRWSSTQVYAKGINDDDYFNVGEGVASYTAFKYVPFKQIQPYIIDFVYVDTTDPDNLIGTLRQDRKNARLNSIDRGQGQHKSYRYISTQYDDNGKQIPGTGEYSKTDYDWITDKGQDKSGYKLDPDKYKRQLDAMGASNYQAILDKLYNRIELSRKEVVEILSNVNIKDVNSNYSVRDITDYFDNAVRNYRTLLKAVDHALEKPEEKQKSYLEYVFDSSKWGRSDAAYAREAIEELEQKLKEYKDKIAQ